MQPGQANTRTAGAQAYWRRFFPAAQPQPAPCALSRRTIYILPNRSGLLFAVVLLTLLIGAINYNLALGHALVFLLAALGLVSMVHAFVTCMASRLPRSGRRLCLPATRPSSNWRSTIPRPAPATPCACGRRRSCRSNLRWRPSTGKRCKWPYPPPAVAGWNCHACAWKAAIRWVYSLPGAALGRRCDCWFIPVPVTCPCPP